MANGSELVLLDVMFVDKTNLKVTHNLFIIKSSNVSVLYIACLSPEINNLFLAVPFVKCYTNKFTCINNTFNSLG